MLLSQLLAPFGSDVPSASVAMILQDDADAVHVVTLTMSVFVALGFMILPSNVRCVIVIMHPAHVSQILVRFQFFVLSAGAAICQRLDVSAAHVIVHTMPPVPVYRCAVSVCIMYTLALHSSLDLSRLLIMALLRMNALTVARCFLQARRNI